MHQTLAMDLKICIFIFIFALTTNSAFVDDGSTTKLSNFHQKSVKATNHVTGKSASQGTSEAQDESHRVSACEGRTCNNRGDCYADPEMPEDYKCKCEVPFRGRDCEIKMLCDPYDKDSCKNGGKCVINESDPEEKVYRCQCSKDFTGDACEIDESVWPIFVQLPPNDVVISEGETAEVHVEFTGDPFPTVKWERFMRRDWEIDGLRIQVRSEKKGFSSLIIKNTTESDSGNYECILQNTNGYTSNFIFSLKVQIKPCKERTCGGRGTCTLDPENEDGYKCLCNDPFAGKDCEIEIACNSNPCQNEGKCKWIEDGNEYECACLYPYGGKNCEKTKYCEGVTCRNRGTCGLNEDKDDYECTCEYPYMGKDCEIGCGKECEVGEECYLNNDEPECRCKENFIGGKSGKSGCLECSCPENSLCILIVNGSSEEVGCLCNEGLRFHDGLCKEICNPDPCRNGKCSQFGTNSYSCKCNPGYIGINCDEEDTAWKETNDSYVFNAITIAVVIGAVILVSIIGRNYICKRRYVPLMTTTGTTIKK